MLSEEHYILQYKGLIELHQLIIEKKIALNVERIKAYDASKKFAIDTQIKELDNNLHDVQLQIKQLKKNNIIDAIDKFEILTEPKIDKCIPEAINECNREKNYSIIRSFAYSNSYNPKFFIIHGDENDKHDSLLKRLSEELNNDFYCQRYNEILIPGNGDIKTFLKDLYKEMGFEYTENLIISENQIFPIKEIKSLPDNFIIHLSLRSKNWNARTYKFVCWLIDKFWKIHTSKQIFIFINLIYQEKSTYLPLGILIKLKLSNLIKRNSNCIVIPKLETISKADIRDFLDKKLNIKMNDSDLNEIFPGDEFKMRNLELRYLSMLKKIRK